MTKARHPYFLRLRVLAGKLELGLLSPDETGVLAEIIRRLAGGETLDEIFGIKRYANRPIRNTTEHFVEQVFGLIELNQGQTQKMKVGDAITLVAAEAKVSDETVKAAYYSKPGREHLKLLKETLVDPISFLSR